MSDLDDHTSMSTKALNSETVLVQFGAKLKI
jgi:hypothetical protein